MTGETNPAERMFTTAWFARAAKKSRISESELCRAIRQVMLGQADNLGGGVWKKRLGNNLYRSILVAKGRRFWVYVYLFAKQDRANIDDDELAAFRDLADLYARKTDAEIAKELRAGALMEICHA